MKTITVDLVLSDEEHAAISRIYVPAGRENLGLPLRIVANLAPNARVCSHAYSRVETTADLAKTIAGEAYMVAAEVANGPTT